MNFWVAQLSIAEYIIVETNVWVRGTQRLLQRERARETSRDAISTAASSISLLHAGNGPWIL